MENSATEEQPSIYSELEEGELTEESTGAVADIGTFPKITINRPSSKKAAKIAPPKAKTTTKWVSSNLSRTGRYEAQEEKLYRPFNWIREYNTAHNVSEQYQKEADALRRILISGAHSHIKKSLARNREIIDGGRTVQIFDSLKKQKSFPRFKAFPQREIRSFTRPECVPVYFMYTSTGVAYSSFLARDQVGNRVLYSSPQPSRLPGDYTERNGFEEQDEPPRLVEDGYDQQLSGYEYRTDVPHESRVYRRVHKLPVSRVMRSKAHKLKVKKQGGIDHLDVKMFRDTKGSQLRLINSLQSAGKLLN